MTIQDIRAKLADEVRYVEDVMADINERSAEDGSLTDEDTAAFAAGVAFREEGRAKLAVLEARSEALSARTAPVEGLNQINKPSERSVYDVSEIRYGAPAAEVRDRGVRAIDATRGLTDDQKTQAEHVMRSAEGDRDGSVARHIVATGNPEYRSAFVKALGGEADMWSNEERAAVQAVRAASLTNNAGGFAVPFTLDTTIIDTGRLTRSVRSAVLCRPQRIRGTVLALLASRRAGTRRPPRFRTMLLRSHSLRSRFTRVRRSFRSRSRSGRTGPVWSRMSAR